MGSALCLLSLCAEDATMRIDPDQQISARLRQVTTSSPATDSGFASALADASETGAASADVRDKGGRQTVTERPPAEQWGQYGLGASVAGYGDPPDPSLYASVPVGLNAPAHPLNPEGNTTTEVPFTVPGYTGRGTPIPPGFYNLAYYNRYLAEGGTPLEGFDAYDAANGSLTDVYGSFGDGRTRAIAFNGTTSAGGRLTKVTQAAGTDATSQTVGASVASTQARDDALPADDASAARAAATPSGTIQAADAAATLAGSAPATAHPRADEAAGTDATESSPEDRLRAAAEALLGDATNAVTRAGLEALLDDLARTG
jgi:hypothetical protein